MPVRAQLQLAAGTSTLKLLFLDVLQADCLSEPRDVFAYLKVSAVPFCSPSQLYVTSRPVSHFVMQEHDIGQDFALYYTAFATYLELRGSFAKAGAVYEAGLERCAMQSD